MKKITKIASAALSACLACSFLAACGGGGGEGITVPDLNNGYTYTKQSTDGLMQFYSSDSGLDAFLNEYMERHLRYSDRAVDNLKVGDASSAWKEWEAMSVMWMNTGAIGYSPKENIKNALTNIYQDDFGFIWVDNGTSETDWGQSWEFPSDNHSSGKNHTYFDETRAAAVTTGWKAYTDVSDGYGVVPGDGTSTDYIYVDGSDITSATFETLSSIGDMAVPFCAPFLEINLTLIDRDSLGHSEQIEDINVYWQLNGSGGYDEQHKVSYSSFSSNYTEVFPTSSRIVFPMYAHANWGKSETDTVTGMKIEILFKNGINAQVKIDRIALAFDGRQINNNSAFLSAAAYCYKYTQDEEWLEQNLPKFRKAMQFYFTYCTQEGEELATKANFVGHDGSSNYGRIAQGQWSAGVGHGIGDGYWDCISNPLIDAYTNIYYYKALQAMAYLEGAAAEAGISSSEEVRALKPDVSGYESYSQTQAGLEQKAEAVAERFREYFWNEETGRFCLGYLNDDDAGLLAGALDKTVDFGYTKYNQEAVDLGLATQQQAESIMSWINGERTVAGDTSTGEDIYRYEFAPRFSTKVNDYQYWFNYNGTPSGSYAWDKQIINGGASLQNAYYDLAAEMAVNGTESAFGKLKNLQSWYEKVKEVGGTGTSFYRDYYLLEGVTPQGNGRSGVVGVDSEFVEATLLYASVPLLFFGLDSTAAGTLNIAPALPDSLTFWKMENVTFGDVMYDVTVGKNFVQINSVSAQNDYKVCVSLPKPSGSFTVRQHDRVLEEGKDYTVQGDKVVITVPLTNGRIQTVSA